MGFSGFRPSNVLVAVLVLMFCQSSMAQLHNYYLLSPQVNAVAWLAAEVTEVCELISALNTAMVAEWGSLS